MATKKRMLFVVNKYWECDPVCWVLTNKYILDTCGIALKWPAILHYPTYGPLNVSSPRMVFELADARVEIWCISDLLARFPDTPDYQSSSERKMAVMPEIFSYSTMPVTLVAAVGTASSGPTCPPFDDKAQDDINGSVVVGSKVFMHDGHPASDPNPASRWRCDYFDQLMDSGLDVGTVAGLGAREPFRNLESLLLCPPTNPATHGQHVYIDVDYAAIGDVNVTNYKEYQAKDQQAGDAFISHCPGNSGGVSLETTHGLIYAQAKTSVSDGGPPPFMFISGIVDRYLKFDTDVGPKTYAQNVTGAHNAGVMVAYLISIWNRLGQ